MLQNIELCGRDSVVCVRHWEMTDDNIRAMFEGTDVSRMILLMHDVVLTKNVVEMGYV